MKKQREIERKREEGEEIKREEAPLGYERSVI